MKRIIAVLIAALCLSAASLAQASVPSETALTAAVADINARLGTNLTYNGGQLIYQFREVRLSGDNLGCPSVAATNQNNYVVMITSFDLDFNGDFEWEYRFAYEADGTLRMVACSVPDVAAQQTQAAAPTAVPPTPTDDAAASPDAPTQQATPAAVPIYGRDGPRIFPATTCGGLPTRLVNGGIGRVAPGGAANNLRQTSDVSSLKLGELPAGAAFVVLDGPFCNGGIAWYLVAAHAVPAGGAAEWYAIGENTTPLGWTAEGNNGDYFLEPVVTDALAIRPDNVEQLVPVGSPFAPDAQAIDATWPGGLLVTTADATQLWTVAGAFAPSASLAFGLAREVPEAAPWAFIDNTGRWWTAAIDAGSLTLETAHDPISLSINQSTSGSVPVLAVDNESNFAVILTDDQSLALYQLGTRGGETGVITTLPLDGPLLDVAISPNSMRLYVLGAGTLTVYQYVMGEGWSTQPMQVIEHGLASGQIAIDESNDRVAISGLTGDNEAAIRIISGLSDETAGNETSVDGDAGAAGLLYSRPSFNADGSLAAVRASDGTVLLFDTATGGAFTLPTAGDDGALGAVAFSRDGLLLWVAGTNGVQTYAVPQP